MANKNSVEDLLIQFFGSELTSSPSANVINISEEWLKNSNKNIEVLIDNIAPATIQTTIVNENETDTVEDEIPDEKPSSPIDINNVSDEEFEQLFRMKRTTALDLQIELNSLDDETNSNLDQIDTSLLVCLWMLGNTKTIKEISDILGTTQERVENICDIYFSKILALSPKYIYWPSHTEILAIEKGFLDEYKFPGVIGVIGCLHIAVYVDENDPNESKYFNKNAKNHTIVLQAVCDNNLFFRDLFAGYPGSNSITTILKASSLYTILTEENSLLIKLRKHLLGGTEHPQLTTLLTPYTVSGRDKLTEREQKFNNLHGAVMYTVEKTFRMVENRFPRMRSLETVNPRFATLAAGCICTLHNYCKLRDDLTCC